MGEGIVELTTSTWDKEVLQGQGVVMVDFWASMVRALQDDCAHS